MRERVAMIAVLAALAVTTPLYPQEPEKDQPSKEAAAEAKEKTIANPGGDWVDWGDVEKKYSSKALAKISDPDARAVVQAIVTENVETRRNALSDFKTGAGLGLSVALGSRQDSIEEATIVDGRIVVTRRSKDQPRAALEIHQLFTTNVFTTTGRANAVQQLRECGADPIDCPMFGIGPFAALQTGANESISSIGLGVMIGVRTDPRQSSSFNLGLGVAFDARTKVLADGFTEGAAPPGGATEVKFAERSRRRLLLNLSFAF